jgi:hypothetical protein
MAQGSGKGTIAIVTLFLFVIVELVGVWYFWDKSDKLEQTASEAKKSADDARKEANTTKNNYGELRGFTIGAKHEADHAAAINEIKANITGQSIGEQRRKDFDNTITAIQYLVGEVRAADAANQKLQEENGQLQADLKSIRERYNEQVNVAENARKAREAEVIEITAKDKEHIDQLQTQFDAVNLEKGRIQIQLEEERRVAAEKVKQLTKQGADMALTIMQLKREKAADAAKKFEHADGRVEMVTNGGQEATINLGFQDGLRLGMTFGIYGKDKGGNQEMLPKANLEVVRIKGQREAIGRITDSKIADPVIPGDLLFNPIWDPGKLESIAIAGLIYLDDDREPDNAAFKRIVEELYHCKIDAEFNFRTLLNVGAITPQTGWLVIGDIPDSEEAGEDQRRVQLYRAIADEASKMRREADSAGVRVVNVDNFLSYMGKQIPTRTIPGGEEAKLLYSPKATRRPAKATEKSNGERTSGE